MDRFSRPCKKCGGSEWLRVVKTDSSVTNTKVFGWSKELRDKVLKKCIVLCRSCMVTHYSEILRKKYQGKRGTENILNAELVWAIRGRLMGRESSRKIAEYYKITHGTVLDIKTGKLWGWLTGGKRTVYGLSKNFPKEKGLIK